MGLTDYVAGSAVGQAIEGGATGVYNSISSIQNYVNGVTGSYIINPYGMKGIAGFVFDYEGDDEQVFESEIPDHYSENNTTIQDHIANKAPHITLRGFISELYTPPQNQGIFGTLTTLQQKMGTVQAYLGKYTPQALQNLEGSASKAVSQVQNYAAQAAGYLNQAKNIAAAFGGATGASTRQQQAYAALVSLWSQKQIFNVLTPWTLMPSMGIELLSFKQDTKTKTITDIVVRMKQMRFVDVQSSQNTTATKQGRAGFSYQSKTNLGLTSGTPTLLGSTPLASAASF